MYVTRRLLRSTLPTAEPSTAAASSSAVEEPKPETRASRHSSSKAKSPTTKKKASTPCSSQSSKTPAETPETAVEDRAALHGHGLLVDALSADKWCEARVLDLDPVKKAAFIHYMGWNSRYDAWVEVAQLTPHRRHTKGTVKKGASWTGKRSLFYGAKLSTGSSEIKAEAKQQPAEQGDVRTTKAEQKATPKSVQPAKIKRPASARKASPVTDRKKAAPVARKKYNRVSSSSSSEEERDEEDTPRAKAREGSDSRERKKPSRVLERAIQRGVQVVVETLGEDRERKLRGRTSGNVDLELDVDIRGRFSTSPMSSVEPNDREDDDDEGDENDDEGNARSQSKTRSRTPTRSKKRAAARDSRSKTRNARQRTDSNSEEDYIPPSNAAAHASPRPPMDPVDAGTFATKEKLAAIFRLRLHRKQQLMGELSDPNLLSMQEELRRAAAAPSATAGQQPAYSPRTMAANQAYLQHLERQQYCYQQAMLAAGLPTLAGMDNNPTLYGGVMDPRIIQARMDDLEHQRMLQQQQIQDYYARVLAVRERNMSALASTTDFLQHAEDTWQKQLTTQEGGGGGADTTGDNQQQQQESSAASQAQSSEPEPEKAAGDAANCPAAAASKEQQLRHPTDAGIIFSESRPPQHKVLYECAL